MADRPDFIVRRALASAVPTRPGLAGSPERSFARSTRDRRPSELGFKPGDLVTELGGTPVRNAADLHVRLALLRIGEVAVVALSRPSGMLTVRAEMAEREPAAHSR